MRRFASASLVFLTLPVLVAGLLGCKPDAAVERGAVVGAGPNSTEKGADKHGQPTGNVPKTDQQPPLTKVQ